MEFVDTLEWEVMEKNIRYGQQPDNPCVLYDYLKLSNQYTLEQECITAKRSIQLRVYRTLLDTICDSFVAPHWRALCVDYIYQPMQALENLCRSETDRLQLMRLRQEFCVLSSYFCS